MGSPDSLFGPLTLGPLLAQQGLPPPQPLTILQNIEKIRSDLIEAEKRLNNIINLLDPTTREEGDETSPIGEGLVREFRILESATDEVRLSLKQVEQQFGILTKE